MKVLMLTITRNESNDHDKSVNSMAGLSRIAFAQLLGCATNWMGRLKFPGSFCKTR